MTQEPDKTSDVIDLLAEGLQPLVAHIEGLPLTTKGHYGDYMVAIEKVADRLPASERTTAVYLGIALALRRAGGNSGGIIWALRILGHLG